MEITPESFLGGKVSLFCGESLSVLKSIPDDQFDSIVTDPPYALVSIVKRFGKNGAAPAKGNEAFMRASAGFMGKAWDTGDTAHAVEFWQECMRVLKPGGHVVAFAGTRTYHRLACAIEDAGFEIRDCIMWVYGSGFPKSHDVSKGIDRAAGAEREIVGRKTGRAATPVQDIRNGSYAGGNGKNSAIDCSAITAPATDAARQWQGWGSALKPAVEPIVLARKPLSESTVAANVLRWRTGAINVDGCRVEGEPWKEHTATGLGSVKFFTEGEAPEIVKSPNVLGRWPANLVHDGSEEVLSGFPETGPANIGNRGLDTGIQGGKFAAGERAKVWIDKIAGYDDNGGSAARFFYTAKADSDDRLGSKHPTVKPVDLMQWLVRLITPKGGLVLDPFAGTGTTAEACIREGMRCTLIERESEYQADIRRRMALVMAGPDERVRESVKAKGLPVDHGPLFGAMK